MNVAIIPARGGSKRIPRKNIKPFHGKPIIAYSIETALQSGCFGRVIVSTDDAEIAEIAKQYGADVPFIRPAVLSDDYASTLDVISHALLQLEQDDSDIELACCIYPTAPLITVQDLQQGQAILNQDKTVRYAFSAEEYNFPIQRAIKLSDKGRVSMFMPEHEHTRSQDLTPAYHDAGQFYWGRKEAFCAHDKIFAEHSKTVAIPSIRAIDIDTPNDWDIAEFLYQYHSASHANRY